MIFGRLILILPHCLKARENISSPMGTSTILREPVPACYVQTVHFRTKVILKQLSIFHSCDHTVNTCRTNYPPRLYDTLYCDPLWMQWRDNTEMRIFRTPLAPILLVHLTIQLKKGLIKEPGLVFADGIIFKSPNHLVCKICQPHSVFPHPPQL